jgi:hypothetical protein
MEGGGNFASLRGLRWRLHVYGDAQARLAGAAAEAGIGLASFPWSDAAAGAGLEKDAAYLVRPDGHVAWASSAADAGLLKAFVERWHLKGDTQ